MLVFVGFVCFCREMGGGERSVHPTVQPHRFLLGFCCSANPGVVENWLARGGGGGGSFEPLSWNPPPFWAPMTGTPDGPTG